MSFAKNNKNKLLLLLIIFSGVFIRFYNFNNRITYGPEQARSLYVSASYIKDKFSLLGQEYFKTTVSGHKLYSGAIFSYSLVPLLILSNYDPVFITSFFALLNLLTGFLIFLYLYRKKECVAGLISSFLFLFNSTMIYHSMFIWILNYMPLFGLILYILIFDNKWHIKKLQPFYVGLLCGLGINFHYPFIIFAIPIYFYIFLKHKGNYITLTQLLGGFCIGNFSIIIFDLRHNFYHLRTLFEFVINSLSTNNSSIQYYWFLFLWAPSSILFGKLLTKLWRKHKFHIFLALFLYLFVNLKSSSINFRKPVGMPDGLSYNDIYKASKIISQDASENFNVISLLDFDKRGYILRYPIKYIFHKDIQGEVDYPNDKVVYVLSENNYDYNVSDVWEVKSVCPCITESLGKIGKGYLIAKLTRI